MCYIQQIVNGPNIHYDCDTNQDTPEFTATDMCCACGGGISWNRGSLESTSQLRCEDKHDICDTFDASSCIVTDTFDPTDFCCVCGGGRTVRYFDMETVSLNSLGQSCTDISGISNYGGVQEACAATYDTSEFHRGGTLCVLWRRTAIFMFT